MIARVRKNDQEADVRLYLCPRTGEIHVFAPDWIGQTPFNLSNYRAYELALWSHQPGCYLNLGGLWMFNLNSSDIADALTRS